MVRPAYIVVLGAALFIALAVGLTDFNYDASAMNRPVFGLMTLTVLGAWLARLGLRIGSAMEAMALFSALSFAAPFCSVILAAFEFPLTDAVLLTVDRYLLFGFEREKIVIALTGYPWLFDAIRVIYGSLLVQPSLLFVLLWATGREVRGWVFLSGWAIALVVTLAIFTVVPAMGASPFFLDYMDTLRHARDGTLRVLGTQVLAGIITFPSFHAAAAVLLGWGFAPIPRIGRFFVVWNALMFASAVFASHYVIDLIAGGVIGATSIWVAKRVLAYASAAPVLVGADQPANDDRLIPAATA